MVAHTFSLSTGRQTDGSLRFEASLVCRVPGQPTSVTQRNCLEKPNPRLRVSLL
ncbi:hypothetical protein ACRRTK_018424 [Alexandromys fortis]